jgi:hypothetical protein
MKRYWDASALGDALHDPRVEQKALEPDQWTRVHTLAETFSTPTGGRLGIQYLHLREKEFAPDRDGKEAKEIISRLRAPLAEVWAAASFSASR